MIGLRDVSPMRMRAAVIAAVIALPAVGFAADRGAFGFSMEIDGDGFFLNPTVRAIRISKVLPESPAARAGMQAGDDVVEVAGQTVAGRKGRDLQPLAEKEVGQPLQLKVRHRDGQVVSITMVAVDRASLK